MKLRRLTFVCLALLGTAAAIVIAYRMDKGLRPELYRPGHRHCIKQIGFAFSMYAAEHNGHWPAHTNGYGDALLLTLPYLNKSYSLLTGPGFDPAVFMRAHESGSDVPEEQCGRVYIQGLTESNAADLIVLFDKRPSLGGDHFPANPFRSRPLLREVLCHAGNMEVYLEDDWPNVVTQQVEWLVEAGFDRSLAEWYYSHGEEPQSQHPPGR